MRSALLTLILAASVSLASAADVEFLRVWPGWRDADSFDRISEYFGRGEATGGHIIVRTQPAVRAGYYFLVRLKSSQAIPVAKFELSVVRPDTAKPKVHTFTAAVPGKECVLELGLTGTDWPAGVKANPVAWKISVAGADGRVLGEHQSFLWAKPAK